MMSKKVIGIIIAVIVLIVAIVAVVLMKNATPKNVEGTLEEIMTKLYVGINQDNLPMMLSNMEISKESLENFVGTSEIDMKEAMVSESGVGSIAHSVVLIRLNDVSKANDAVTKIKGHANPRKWICVEASNVVVKSKGDLVVLIMSNEELAPKLETNFDGLV